MRLRIEFYERERVSIISRRALEVLQRHDLQSYCAAHTAGFIPDAIVSELEFNELGELMSSGQRMDPYTLLRALSLSGARETRLDFGGETVIVTVLDA